MWKRTLRAAIACLSLGLFIAPMANAAEAECACMCVDAEPMYVCTGGFISSQTTTDECTAALECPALTDPPGDVPPITDAVDPNVPPGMACRPRNVWRPDLGKYKEYKVCSPSALVASNDDDDGEHGNRHQQKNQWSKGQNHYQQDDDD